MARPGDVFCKREPASILLAKAIGRGLVIRCRFLLDFLFLSKSIYDWMVCRSSIIDSSLRILLGNPIILSSNAFSVYGITIFGVLGFVIFQIAEIGK